MLDTCKRLEKYGYEVTYLPVAKDGRIDLDDLRRAITPKTILITIMYANNEIGVIQPIDEIGKIAKEKGVFFHTDAVQAVGKIPVDVQKDNIDLLVAYRAQDVRPEGRCGALYVRRRNPRVQLASIIDGGGHERGMRSGTLNVPGIVGFGKAAELCQKEMPEESKRLRGLRDRLKDGLFAKLDEVYINGSMIHRLPNNLNISFAFVEGESLADGHQRRGGIERLGLHLGHARTQLRAEGAGRGRGSGAHFDPLRAGALQHPGGSGLRHQPRGRGR